MPYAHFKNILSNSCNNILESVIILNSISDHFPISNVTSQTQNEEKPNDKTHQVLSSSLVC